MNVFERLLAKTTIDASQVGIPNTGVDENNLLQSVLGLVFFFFGVVATLTIIFAGIMYVTSEGNADKAKRAKNAILYGVVGLVVTLLAFSIVGFILNWFA
jgi:predicted benzoate:H+ symporter BenE